MNRKARLALYFISVVVAVALMARAEVVDRIVAVVGSGVITQSELDRAYNVDSLRLKEPDPITGASYSDIGREDYLDKMIERKVIEQEVRRQGINVGALEVEKAIDRKRESLGISPEEFAEELSKQGISMDDYRAAVKDQLITFRLIGQEVRGEVEVTDQEILNYYNQHLAQFMEKDRLRLSHIFIPFPLPEPEPVEDDKDKKDKKGEKKEDKPLTKEELEERTIEKLKDIRKRIEAGAVFEEMAKEHSKTPTADKGGDLGWFTRDELLPVFRTKIEDLEEGRMCEVFVHGGGAHLILLKEFKQGGMKPLDQVKDQIRDVLFQNEAMERYDLWLDRLKARTHIENRLKKKPPDEKKSDK